MFSNINKLNDLEKIAKIWQIELNIEYMKPKKNVRISFKDVGPFCEYIALDYVKGYSGGGSGGMGFDLYNKLEKKAIEVKSCCTIQNAKCLNCGTKYNHLFLDYCPDCGSDKRKESQDSRFGIKAIETLNQNNKKIFGGFILSYVSKKEHNRNKKTLTISIEWFKIDFDDDEELKKIRLDYFENQKKFGKKDTNNLLPYSFDFFKLSPLKINETIIKINYGDLNTTPKIFTNNICYYPKVDANKLHLKNDEKNIFKNLTTYDAKTNTAESQDFTLNIPYRIKNLGKERGNTRANIYKNLK